MANNRVANKNKVWFFNSKGPPMDILSLTRGADRAASYFVYSTIRGQRTISLGRKAVRTEMNYSF